MVERDNWLALEGGECMKCICIGKQSVLGADEHATGKALHEGSCLHVQVAKHFIGAPAADELDSIRVDAGTEECHRAGGAERAGADIRGKEAKGGRAQLSYHRF